MHRGKAVAGNTEIDSRRRGSRGRIAVWGAAVLMLLSLFAIEVTGEVK
jgi:hypothetical protein